ncbi:MAG: hypothetical protein HW417_1913, partial [Steroidobacteraceae bacterium]|nr:hypothetical protein [Steroidobacteraceae bacterium]
MKGAMIRKAPLKAVRANPAGFTSSTAAAMYSATTVATDSMSAGL